MLPPGSSLWGGSSILIKVWMKRRECGVKTRLYRCCRHFQSTEGRWNNAKTGLSLWHGAWAAHSYNTAAMSNQEGLLWQHLAGKDCCDNTSPRFLPMLLAFDIEQLGQKPGDSSVWLVSEHRLAHLGIWFSLGMTADWWRTSKYHQQPTYPVIQHRVPRWFL